MANVVIKLSEKGNHLVFIGANYEDGIGVEGSVKIGVLPLEDPSKAEATLKKAQGMKWEFGAEKDGGFFEVLRG